MKKSTVSEKGTNSEQNCTKVDKGTKKTDFLRRGKWFVNKTNINPLRSIISRIL